MLKRWFPLAAALALLPNCQSATQTTAEAKPCEGPGPSLAVPLVTSPDQHYIVHWDTQPGCIPVTYDPALSSYAADITSAFSAWGKVSGSSLCFGAPTASSTVPDVKERSVHLAVTTDASSQQFDVLPKSNYTAATGALLSASISVLQPSSAPLTASSFLHAAGGLVPLNSFTLDAGVPSALYMPDPADSVTDADETSVRALYGTPTLCSGS